MCEGIDLPLYSALKPSYASIAACLNYKELYWLL